MSYNTTVPPPKIVDREFIKPALCGPGPCDVWPSVAEAYSKPVITPMCDEYFHVLDDIREGMKYIFQTKSKLVLALSGAGHAGMEAVITNLVGPGETLLIAARGMWDERAFIIAKRYGIKVEVTRVPLYATFKLEHLEAEIKRLRPTALFITHGDSSTGTVQKIQGLGDICHKYGTLLIVDTVVSLVGEPFLTDAWGVDAVYTSTQKAFSGPAGISPVAFSARAEEKINNRRHEPPFYLDIKLLAPQWNCYGNTRSYHHTLSPPMLWALRACIKEVLKQSIEQSWARHAATLAHLHKRLRELSFDFFVPVPEDRLATVTTITLPKGYDYLEFVKYMRANHNILIFGGIGPTVGKMLRVGTMGINSTIKMADEIADGMADTLRALKKSSL
ncbi:alanine-glyoxylate aminotransferase isoform X2 [Anticarsia gemmatalis]